MLCYFSYANLGLWWAIEKVRVSDLAGELSDAAQGGSSDPLQKIFHCVTA
jgi:hypothetical protein